MLKATISKHFLILSSCFLTLLSCQPKSEKESIAHGEEVYITHCISCHQVDGKGVEGIYPSLVKPDDITMDQTRRAITLIKQGSAFEAGMKPVALTNKEIRDVVNYIQNTWENEAAFLTKAELEQIQNQ